VSKGAAAKRFSRLKKKIEAGSPLTTTAFTRSASSTPVTPKTTANGSAQERKLNETPDSKNARVKVDKDETNDEMDIPKRKTRGKKLNYNLSALEDSENEEKKAAIDDDFSDPEYNAEDDPEDADIDADLEVTLNHNIKPAFKPGKKKAPLTYLRARTPTPASRKNLVPRKQLAGKLQPQATVAAKPKMHPSNIPIPSIERSPTPILEESRAVLVSESASESGSDGDIDIKSLKPGTILTFGHTETEKANPSVVHRSTNSSASASVSPSPSSAATMLQMQLKQYTRDVCPETSVSMTDVEENEKETAKVPVTPEGMFFHVGASTM
jgi:hypothetical protein